MTCNGGISTDDFNQILSDFNRTVSYKVVTKTVSGMGDETSTFAAASDVSLVFFVEEQRFMFDKQGLLEVGDAYVLAPITVGIKRYDQLTVGGETYYIQNIIHRYVLNTQMLDYGVCFKTA